VDLFIGGVIAGRRERVVQGHPVGAQSRDRCLIHIFCIVRVSAV